MKAGVAWQNPEPDGQYSRRNEWPQVTGADLTKSQRLCALDDVPEVGAVAAEASIDQAQESLVVLRRGSEVHAFLNVCPHAGRRLDWAPGRFLVDQGVLVCAAHGACFGIPDGRCISGPCRGQALHEVAVELRDGAVFLVG